MGPITAIRPPTAFRTVFVWLDMNVDGGISKSLQERGFDPVTEPMCIINGHVAWHDQMELHEGQISSDLRSDIMRFDRAPPYELGDKRSKVGDCLRIRCFVKEPTQEPRLFA